MDTGGSQHNGIDRHVRYDQPRVEHKRPLQPMYKIFDINITEMTETSIKDLFILKFNDFIDLDGYKSVKPDSIQQEQLCIELSQPDQLMDSNKYKVRTDYFHLTCVVTPNGVKLLEYQSASKHIWIDETAPDNFYKCDRGLEYQFTNYIVDESRAIKTKVFHDACILDGDDFKTDNITFTRRGLKDKVLITLTQLTDSIDVIDSNSLHTSCASCVAITEINKMLAKFELRFEKSIQEIRELCAEKWQKIQRPRCAYEAWPAMQTSE